ncbi:MAG: T9SS type A sorting domain-containing protein [Crocinitomicaceae bacterium]|nr:T9SS type A sorting domain-containing protein [Crocinitomicaceae bacterium]
MKHKTLLTIVFSYCALACSSQISFREQSIPNYWADFDGLYETTTSVADINGNGFFDVLLSGRTSVQSQDRSDIYYNDNGIFNPAIYSVTGFYNGDSDFADIDGDGDQDLIITGNHEGARTTKLYTNDGSGLFTHVQNTPFVDLYFSSVEFFDKDGDGDQDVIICGNGTPFAATGPMTELFENDGQGNFTLVNSTNYANSPFIEMEDGTISVGDVDNDGDQDVLFVRGEAILYLNDGLGNFTESYNPAIASLTGAKYGYIEDIDGDSFCEIITTGNYETHLFLNAGGTLLYEAPSTAFSDYGGIADFSDIDNDGDIDMLISNGTYLKQFNNIGNGQYVEVQNNNLIVLISGDIKFVDINNDSYEDVIISGRTDSYELYSEVYYNNGNGEFVPMNYTAFPIFSHGVTAMADIDNDSDADILFPNGILFENVGNELFIEANGYPSEDLWVNVGNSYSIEFADVNNDSSPDVMVAGIGNIGTGGPFLYMNDGNGNYTESLTSSFPTLSGTAIAFADIDNDNDQDAIVTGMDGVIGSTNLYLNDGLGNFTTDQNVFQGVCSGDVKFGDVDNDGDQDLLISGESASSFFEPFFTLLYINDGNGSFQVSTSIFENVVNSSLDFGDIDSDGDLDILILGTRSSCTENGATIFKLYENNGFGDFTEYDAFQPLYGGTTEFCDVDNDGDPDIMVIGSVNGSSSSAITVLFENDGFGQFNIVNGLPFIGFYNGDITFGDVDNDGDQDVLLSSGNDTKLYINEHFVGVETMEELSSEVTFFPNPTSGRIYIKMDQQNTQARINVISSNGVQLFDDAIYVQDGDYFNLEGESGVYFIEVINADYRSIHRVIKY